jgi:hypothetical protein
MKLRKNNQQLQCCVCVLNATQTLIELLGNDLTPEQKAIIDAFCWDLARQSVRSMGVEHYYDDPMDN